MKMYISGPMSGLPSNNVGAFDLAAQVLRSSGYDVVNPAEIVAGPDATYADFMRADVRALCDCDAIVLLPGHLDSNGSRLEVECARAFGMPVYELLDIVGILGVDKKCSGGCYLQNNTKKIASELEIERNSLFLRVQELEAEIYKASGALNKIGAPKYTSTGCELSLESRIFFLNLPKAPNENQNTKTP